jgi:hypothetical protein
MEEIDIKKNLLDLQHGTYLNYFNMAIILIISCFITIVIGTPRSWTFGTLISASVIVLLIVIVIIFIFRSLTKDIEKKIENLGSKK